MKQYVYAVVGSRGYSNKRRFYDEMDRLKPIISKIISGGARGPDSWAKDYSIRYSIPFLEIPADWDTYGLAAGPIRNGLIADQADRVLAFWDGSSTGTHDLIQKTIVAAKPINIYTLD